LSNVNAPRQKWPKLQKDDGSFTEEYLAYTDDMSVCYNLVTLASGILNRDLELRTGGPKDGIVQAATDGKTIFLPKMHPNRRVAVKHELSHIFFKSSIKLRLLFVGELLDEMEQQMGEKLPPPMREKLTGDLCLFINVLDDIRVNSLWGLLYPGDGMDMEDWYQGQVGPEMFAKAKKAYPNGDVSDLFTFAILLCLRQPAESTEWGEFKDEVETAPDDVVFKSFPAALAITRRLVLRVARKLAQRQQEQPAWGAEGASGIGDASDQDVADEGDIDRMIKERIQEKKPLEPRGLSRAVKKMASGKSPGADFVDHNAGFDVNDQSGTPQNPTPGADEERKLRLLQRALKNIGMDDDVEFSKFLSEQESAGVAAVQQVQRAMNDQPAAGNYRCEDDFIRKGVKADVVLNRVNRSGLVPVVLNREDRDAAERWRRYFQRVLGSSRSRLEEEGHELDTGAYIEQWISGQEHPCYAHDVAGRGFRVTKLVDMSGSMGGVFQQVEKLDAVLQRALDFPFVHLDTVGFQSLESGTVNLNLYPRNATGLTGSRSRVSGVTPISHAIQVAGRRLKDKRDDRHIFILTDGFPVYRLKGHDRHVGTRSLMNWTRDAVQELRAQQVKVWCWMIGHATPSDEEMTEMFGPRNWRKIDSKKVYQSSFDFIVKCFMRFLKTR
jgi:hypothetical protein